MNVNAPYMLLSIQSSFPNSKDRHVVYSKTQNSHRKSHRILHPVVTSLDDQNTGAQLGLPNLFR